MRTELLMSFVLRITSGPRVKFVDSKTIFTPPAPPPPKKQLFMLLTVLRRWSRCFSYSLWVCGLYYGVLHVLKSCLALLFVRSFSPVITSLGEEDAGLYAYRAFVCLFCTC